MKKLEKCFERGANVDETNKDGSTALMLAVKGNRREAVQFLIKNKANVDHVAKDGQFALFVAADLCLVDICAILLNAGANKALMCKGQTASERAVERRYKDVAAFIDAWGQVRALLSFTLTCLCACVQAYKQGDIISAAKKGDVKQLEQCLQNGASIEEKGEYGTPLIYAAAYGHNAAVVFLLGKKADIHYTHTPGGFALSNAASYGRKEVCETLIKAGADLSQEYSGKTAAGHAAAKGHKDLVSLLSPPKVVFMSL